MKILGALLGAIVSPILMVALVVAVYPRTTGTNYDSGTPMLTMGAAVCLVIVGAIAGVLIVAALQGGNSRGALVIACVLLLAIGVFPAWLWRTWYLPQPPISPRNSRERTKWAADKNEFYARYGFDERTGLSLASEVRTALRDGNVASLAWRRYQGDEEGFSKTVPAYRIEDDGWRYDLVPDWPGRAVVFLDPRLERPVVFDVNGWDIYRRASREAPAFATDSSLAGILAIPDCIARFAQAARTDGRWDGNADSLPAAMADRWSAAEGCPVIRAYERPERPGQPWRFEVVGSWARFEIRPDPSDAATPFRFSFRREGRGFMREANGAWHANLAGPADVKDPPPPRCYFDFTVACDVAPLPPLPPR